MPVLASGNGPYLVKETSWVASGVAGRPCQAARTPAAGRGETEPSRRAGADCSLFAACISVILTAGFSHLLP